jgi:hypothetical protein
MLDPAVTADSGSVRKPDRDMLAQLQEFAPPSYDVQIGFNAASGIPPVSAGKEADVIAREVLMCICECPQDDRNNPRWRSNVLSIPATVSADNREKWALASGSASDQEGVVMVRCERSDHAQPAKVVPSPDLGASGTQRQQLAQECNWTMLQEELFLFVEFVAIIQTQNMMLSGADGPVSAAALTATQGSRQKQRTRAMTCGWCMLPIRSLASTSSTKRLTETIWGGSPFYEHSLRPESRRTRWTAFKQLLGGGRKASVLDMIVTPLSRLPLPQQVTQQNFPRYCLT